ncbi:MAG: sulfatase-like hydrolase/transferase [Bacteroidota bacterium]
MKTTFYKNLILTLLLSVTLLQCSVPEEAPAKPNILFIFADDLTYSSIAALGNDEIQTPNLDRLVAGGTSFTNAYNMGGWNGAICVASRAMLISGLSVWRAQQQSDRWREGQEFDRSWGQRMSRAGYQTYMSGKWHVTAPSDSIFQTVAHERPGMPRDFWRDRKQADYNDPELDLNTVMPVGYNRPLATDDNSWSPTDPQFGGFWEGGTHWSEVVRNDAVQFMDSAQQKGDPFFLYLAFNAAHDPRQAPQEYVDMYPLDNIGLESSFAPLYPYRYDIGCGPGLRDEALAPFPRTEYAVKVHKQEYYALITHMDEQIGQILQRLEETGEKDNTYIFFTADHGLSVGRHGLIGKQNMYQHSMKVPLIVNGPGIPANEIRDQQVYLQDVMATALELGGADGMEAVEFKSLMPIINDAATGDNYEPVYGCYTRLQRMVIKDDWKMILYPEISKVRLYNLVEDPEEINDLGEDPGQEARIRGLFTELLKLQQQMGDELDLSEAFGEWIGS